MKNVNKKFLLFGLSYFLLFCAYTIAQVIKETIFAHTVGLHYINYARLFSVFILVPFVLFYSYLVDKIQKRRLIIVVFSSYAILQIACASFLTNPIIGLANTQTDVWRIFGWIFFFLIECFAPFMLSVFWAYVNSTSSPEQAKKQYSTIITFGSLGGMLSAGLSWYYLSKDHFISHAHNAAMHQLVAFASALLILLSAVVIYYLTQTTPDNLLTSYAQRIGEAPAKKEKSGLFSGAQLIFGVPYIFGIFCIVFFYEITSMIIAYLKLYAAQHRSENIAQVTALLFQVTTITQTVGFIFALFGTRTLMRKLGERVCLLLIPTLIACSFLYMVVAQFSFISIIIGFVIIRALNYSFIRPVKEALYIPTDVQARYKAKSWIDTIGTKLAKGTGSACNIFLSSLAGAQLLLGFSGIFLAISAGWTAVAFFLGNQYRKAVKEKHIINE